MQLFENWNYFSGGAAILKYIVEPYDISLNQLKYFNLSITKEIRNITKYLNDFCFLINEKNDKEITAKIYLHFNGVV